MGAPTVSYKQAHSPSPRIKGSLQGLQSTVRYKVDWADAFTFANDVLGLIDGMPWKWPASPNMRATEANIEPIGVQSGASGGGSTPGSYYKSAFVDVTFSSITTNLPMIGTSEQPLANQFDPANPIEMSSFQVQYGAEMIKIPNGAIKWATTDNTGGAQSVPATVRPPSSGSDYLRSPTFNLAITLHNCLGLDATVIKNKIGRVNDALLFSICTAETALLDGVTSSRRQMSNGVAIIDITLNYKWKKVGWNYAMADNGTLYRYVDQGGNPVYAKTDISPLTVISPSLRWRPGS